MKYCKLLAITMNHQTFHSLFNLGPFSSLQRSFTRLYMVGYQITRIVSLPGTCECPLFLGALNPSKEGLQTNQYTGPHLVSR